MKPKFKLSTVQVVKVRFFETLHVIEDGRGESIFVGSEEAAKRIHRLLGKESKKRKRK